MQVRLSRLAALLITAGAGLIAGVGAEAQTLDTTTMIVMGEGLAAGMGNYGLSAPFQNYSFPAQAAAQMNAALSQPLMEPPGIGDVIGYPGQEVQLQTYPQGTVRQFYTVSGQKATSPPIFIQNLSVPELTLQDAVSLAPSLPIAQRSMKQTLVNMTLGFPQLFLNVPVWTQYQYAVNMRPTFTVVELGYYEALTAAVAIDPTQLPNPTTFGQTYSSVLAGLRAQQSQVVAVTIPNPIDTAYFSSPATTAVITATVPFVITAGYGVGAGDYVTRNALTTISGQFANGSLGTLPAGSIMPAATAASITAGVNALNAQIVAAAKANGAFVYDLNAFIHNVAVSGATIGSNSIKSSYLGGFYTLDGVYPGPTGNALIANDFLNFVNSTFKKSYPLINVSTVYAADPVVNYQLPQGFTYTAEQLGLTAHESSRREH